MVSLSKQGSSPDRGRQSAPPPYSTVETFHVNADTNQSTNALHHTIGPQAAQAAPGDHVHDGGSSSPLFQGQGIVGIRGSASYQQSIEALLVRLGATNSATG